MQSGRYQDVPTPLLTLTPAAFGSGLAAALLRARQQACPHEPHELARRVPDMFKGGETGGFSEAASSSARGSGWASNRPV